ncbi:unnamed protein product [Merluccius merluccius]
MTNMLLFLFNPNPNPVDSVDSVDPSMDGKHLPGDGPETQQSSLRQPSSRINTPQVKTFLVPPDAYEVSEKEDTHGPTTQLPANTDCYAGAYAAKVQLPYRTTPGKTPRKIEIERRRREYLKLDIEQLLSEKGVDSKLLMSRHQTSGGEDHVADPDKPTPPVSNYLPLEIFDNEEFDCRTSEDWLALGCEEASAERKPVPAKALLPTDSNAPPDEPDSPSGPHSWQAVGVLDYSQEKIQYLVQKADPDGRIRDRQGKPVVLN